MKVRKASALSRIYGGPQHPISATSPECAFMNAVCNRDVDKALSYFEDEKLFGGVLSAVDTPYGRFEGLKGIREFAEGFEARFNATSVYMIPVVQTIANGRVALEAEFNFVVEDELYQVPMFMVADLRTQNTLDEIRLYCHFSYVPDLQAYRKPMFKSAHLEMGDPNLLTGAVREYYEALHHTPTVDVRRVLNCCSDKCRFGGYHPNDANMKIDEYEDMTQAYNNMALYIPRCVGMRYETIVDDGVNCVIEWVHIVSNAGREERQRIALSGVSAYERGADGKLCAIRISDYAGYEKTIDWDKVDGMTKEEAEAINSVEEFKGGCGLNEQTEFWM